MSEGEPPLATTLRAVAEILGEYDVDSAVLGGVAANVYRDAARTTFDVDLAWKYASAEEGNANTSLRVSARGSFTG